MWSFTSIWHLCKSSLIPFFKQKEKRKRKHTGYYEKIIALLSKLFLIHFSHTTLPFCVGLLLQVGSADALAFFLPGIVSHLAKVLQGSKTMTSGAAGSMESIDQAIRGLAEFLMIVLQDNANSSALDIEASPNFDSNKCKSTLSLLEELRHLQDKDCVKTKAVEDRSVESEKISCSLTELQDIGHTGPDREKLSLHVTRTKDWIQKTSAHVNKLLSATFPHVRSY